MSPKERIGELGATALASLARRREISGIQRAKRFGQTGVDLGFGQRTIGSFEHWTTEMEMEHVGGELEVEIGHLPLLVLRRCR